MSSNNADAHHPASGVAHPSSAGGGHSSHDKWKQGLPHETAFWKQQLEDSDQRWAGDIARRLSDRELNPNMQAAIGAPAGTDVEILDVGSGPLSVLGNVWPGRNLTVIPSDPLADDYNQMLDRLNAPASKRPVRCEAEALTAKFGPNRFDMVFCHNALDHCHDPVKAVDQMLEVAKPGMLVRLEHQQNEGVREAYVGLHQWNLDAQAGAGADGPHFIIWNPQSRIDITEKLRGKATVQCFLNNEWLSVVIKKLA